LTFLLATQDAGDKGCLDGPLSSYSYKHFSFVDLIDGAKKKKVEELPSNLLGVPGESLLEMVGEGKKGVGLSPCFAFLFCQANNFNN